MGWPWHQLDHMQITCIWLQRGNHASTSSLKFLQSGCSSWCPINSMKALKATQYTVNTVWVLVNLSLVASWWNKNVQYAMLPGRHQCSEFLQNFDTVDWVTEKASNLKITRSNYPNDSHLEDLSQPGVVLEDLAQPGVVLEDLAQSGVVFGNTAQPGILLEDLAQPGVIFGNTVQPGVVLEDLAQPGVVFGNTVQPGVGWSSFGGPGSPGPTRSSSRNEGQWGKNWNMSLVNSTLRLKTQ